jgi:ribosomal-protein-alanine N-acetyltransferase
MAELTIDCGCCVLRPFRMSDAESLVRHANNPRIATRVRDRFPHPYTIDNARQFLRGVTRRGANKTEFTLAIEVDGQAVGGIGIVLGTDIERITAELGYWLGEEYWGRGIVTAAIKNFAPWAMDRYQLTRLHADCFTDNPASSRVLEKAGFTRESTKRRAAIKNGEIKDMHLYVMLK